MKKSVTKGRWGGGGGQVKARDSPEGKGALSGGWQAGSGKESAREQEGEGARGGPQRTRRPTRRSSSEWKDFRLRCGWTWKLKGGIRDEGGELKSSQRKSDSGSHACEKQRWIINTKAPLPFGWEYKRVLLPTPTSASPSKATLRCVKLKQSLKN